MSLKDFQIISKLGEGAYSSVYKVKRIIDNKEFCYYVKICFEKSITSRFKRKREIKCS